MPASAGRTRKFCRLYRIWSDMRIRCNNPNRTTHPWYMARGIRYCTEWDDYAVFREWAIANGYRKDLTLDRKDASKDYTPENCRWATRTVQTWTSSGTRKLTFRGETRPSPEWARLYGLEPYIVRDRLRRGWSVERAITTPLQEHRRAHSSGNCKLTEEQVRWIRECELGATEIGRRLGITRGTVNCVRRGETWGHVQ